MNELLELLKAYESDLRADDGSAEGFASLFSRGVELLDLDDEAIAMKFSASRSTASRWRRGKSGPVPALRRQVMAQLVRDVGERIKRFETRASAVGGYDADTRTRNDSDPGPLSAAG